MNNNKEISPAMSVLPERAHNDNPMSFANSTAGNFVMEDTYKNRYRKSKKGIIANIYYHQKHDSKRRNISPPTYTRIELVDWCLEQQIFHELYDNWVASGYDTWLIPSVDRKDDYKGYFLGNIQLMTWRENHRKGIDCEKTRAVHRRSVIQYDTNENIIKEYKSITEAHNKTGATISSIVSACRGRHKTANGYKWKYKNLKS